MRVVVMFNLKADVEPAAYEEWARTRDLPGIRSLPSVDDVTIYRTTGLLGADGKPPYQYVEIIDVGDTDGYATDSGGDAAQTVAREFKQFADAPFFMTTEPLD